MYSCTARRRTFSALVYSSQRYNDKKTVKKGDSLLQERARVREREGEEKSVHAARMVKQPSQYVFLLFHEHYPRSLTRTFCPRRRQEFVCMCFCFISIWESPL